MGDPSFQGWSGAMGAIVTLDSHVVQSDEGIVGLQEVRSDYLMEVTTELNQRNPLLTVTLIAILQQ